MKNTLALVLFSGAGAATGYLITKRKKRKKAWVPILTGALTGGIAGIVATKLKGDSDESLLSLKPKEKVSIQRS